MSLHSLLVQTCSVEKPTFTKDTSGGPVPGYSVVETDIPCSIQSQGGKAVFKFGERMIYITHRFFFDRDVGVKRGYRLKDAEGLYYVIHNYSEVAGRGELWVADAVLQFDG